MKRYSVYCHTNKVNSKRYVGITCQKPSARWRNGWGYKECDYFYRAIVKYGWHNFSHEILYDGLSKEDAEKMEKNLISEWNTLSPNGYNLRSGGGVNSTLAESTKRKLSERLRGTRLGANNPAYGKRGKDSPRYGKHHSTETLTKLSELKQGVYDGNKNPRARSVIKFDGEGNELARFTTVSEAAESVSKGVQTIVNCCRGRQKTAGGYVWRYAITEGGDDNG